MVDLESIIQDTKYMYYENTHTSIVTLVDTYGRQYTGVAMLADEDEDMASEYTGQSIAETRAFIEFYKRWISCELKPQLRALEQLYYSMDRSKKYNGGHYEAYMLNRAIKRTKEDIVSCKEAIDNLKNYLSFYIEEKEKLYQRIRSNNKIKELLEEDTNYQPDDLADID